MIELESKKRMESLKQSIENATGESYEDLTGAVKDTLDRYENKPWYDFVVELTSDVTNGAEFIEVLTPYLTKLRPVKDMVFCTLLNADKQPSNDSTITPLLWGVFLKGIDNKISGRVSRYRGTYSYDASIINIAEAAIGYGCVGLAGDKYFVKVVNVLA